MNKFRKYNLILGWLTFLISLTVYMLTIEPSVSLWDCGEFIATSFGLQVGHPPGAPLYMILGRVFSLFVNDTSDVAAAYNAMSAVASAFTILFLYWTIAHLLKKVFIKNQDDHNSTNYILVMGSAMVGALAYTFSDTFWFSAVEAEVYATSSLFTAVVFWAILKWENIADERYANRWLILIAYLIGLSIGVHLLNLLAIPAMVMVYYFRKYTVSTNGIVKAVLASAVILGSIMYIVIPGLFKISTWFELFFTNTIGLHYNTGMVIYFVLLFSLLAYGIYRTQFIKKNILLNTVFVSLTVIIIGYSSYAMIIVRAMAQPPVNENRPDNAFALLSYLNREQYGDRPLIFGNQYNAEVETVEYNKAVYALNKDTNRYEIAYHKPEVKYRQNKILFPRMYSRDNQHKQAYMQYGTIKEPNNPTYLDNVEFFIRYQLGHMYLRYFMWNFVGKQNDNQGHGGILNGRVVSGIKGIDSLWLGNQKKLTDEMLNHPARNTYYFLPLLLGIIGLLFHYKRHLKDFWVVLLLFILTGIAIVVYLNQTPYQPRERDYAYAGSFYAFSIWIGMGVAGLAEIISRWMKLKTAAVFSLIISLMGVPVLMAAQNWKDHDRSGRFLARDIAKNYLKSCDENAILYTVGDNDTFPLWYMQEVEGFRTDVRVVNMMLFNTDWYIDQKKMKVYKSEPLPITLPYAKYKDGTNNSLFVRENDRWATAMYITNFIKSDDPRTKITLRSGEKVDYVPTPNIVIEVDSAAVLENGIVEPYDADKITDAVRIKLKPNEQILKGNMAQLDIFAHNEWKRPIYFTAGSFSGSLGLESYYQLDGLAYQVVPIKTPQESILVMGRIDPMKMYDMVMNKFSWGRMNEEDVTLDYYSVRTLSVIRFRNLHTRLALALLETGEREKAVEVLDHCMKLAPHSVLPYDQYVGGITFPQGEGSMVHHEGIIEAYFMCGETQKASAIMNEYHEILSQRLGYYNSVESKFRKLIEHETYEAMSQMEELRILKSTYGQDDLMPELNF